MSLFWQELKSNAKALLIWSICQLSLIGMAYLEFVFVFRDNTDVGAIMTALPPAFATLFGIGIHVDFSTARGFYCIMVDFIFYVLAVYASLLGVNVIVREETEKTTAFLYSRPISRRGVLLRKYAAGATCCAVLGFVTFVASALTFGSAPGEHLFFSTVVAGFTAFLMQLVYFAAGAMFAAACATPARATAYNLIFLLGTIMSGKFLGMMGVRGAALVISSRDYFPMDRYLFESGFGVLPWILVVVWVGLFCTVSLVCYDRKDL